MNRYERLAEIEAEEYEPLEECDYCGERAVRDRECLACHTTDEEAV